MIHSAASLPAAFDPVKAGWVAMAIAVTAAISIFTLVLLFSGIPGAGPFNDITNAVNGLLIALFAWQLHALFREHASNTAFLFLLAAWAGSAAIVVSSVLVAFGRMDWMTGALFMALGYGLIGVWFLGLHLLAGPQPFLTQGIVRLGFVAGFAMLFGFLAVPLLVADLIITRNLLTGLAYLGTASGYLLYPLWCWLAGRVLASL